MNEAGTVLVITDDDDVAAPLADLLRRAGERAAIEPSRSLSRALPGAPGVAIILDRDIPAARYTEALEKLESVSEAVSRPLLLLGAGPGGAPPPLPRGWHEDAWAAVSRPPHPGEILTGLHLLRRLAFYRGCRALVHDLSQPATAIHALSRTVAAAIPPDDARREAADRLAREAERLMSLMETFQRTRSAGRG